MLLALETYNFDNYWHAITNIKQLIKYSIIYVNVSNKHKSRLNF